MLAVSRIEIEHMYREQRCPLQRKYFHLLKYEQRNPLYDGKELLCGTWQLILQKNSVCCWLLRVGLFFAMVPKLNKLNAQLVCKKENKDVKFILKKGVYVVVGSSVA